MDKKSTHPLVEKLEGHLSRLRKRAVQIDISHLNTSTDMEYEEIEFFVKLLEASIDLSASIKSWQRLTTNAPPKAWSKAGKKVMASQKAMEAILR